jgi:hypothetical protein
MSSLRTATTLLDERKITLMNHAFVSPACATQRVPSSKPLDFGGRRRFDAEESKNNIQSLSAILLVGEVSSVFRNKRARVPECRTSACIIRPPRINDAQTRSLFSANDTRMDANGRFRKFDAARVHQKFIPRTRGRPFYAPPAVFQPPYIFTCIFCIGGEFFMWRFSACSRLSCRTTTWPGT